MTASTASLYTTIKNPTPYNRFYGYFGRHGTNVGAGSTATSFGQDFVHKYGYNLRKQQSLEKDLLASPPNVEIISTPAPIIQDSAPAAQLANPSSAVTLASTSTTGGSLAAGTYYFAYTYVNKYGETQAGGVSASVAQTASHILTATFPALPTGAVSRNLYIGTTTSTAAMTLYAQGITATTFNIVRANPGNGVDEIQQLAFANSPSGTFQLGILDLNGVMQWTEPITYSGTAATLVSNINTAITASLGGSTLVVASGSAVTAVAITFSGTGYTAAPQPLMQFSSAFTAGSMGLSRVAAGFNGAGSLTVRPPTTNGTKGPTMSAIGLTAGALGAVDPSWGRFTG